MAFKIFIDGQEGTTGLKIINRFEDRDDVIILQINKDKRKDIDARLEKVHKADITFLCLPDEASREIVQMASSNTRIIDASTAHRTSLNWVYGLPELCADQRMKIRASNRVAVPGCHATGFVLLVNPLLALDIVDKDYPFLCNSITGYSGGGKKMISQYEAIKRGIEFNSPRQYGLGGNHKHLAEMTSITGIAYPPIFNPIVSDYYSGMQVTVPLHRRLLRNRIGPKELYDELWEYYKNQPMVKIMDYELKPEVDFIAANELSNRDDLQIHVFGNEEQIVLVARYDNLGKGASGAAIQCMNIMLGLPEET